MSDKTSDEIQHLLKQLVDHFDLEDTAVRTRQIRQYKKLKYYWDGFYNVYWSEVAHDWRIFNTQVSTEESGSGTAYDKPVNVFRAYLEAIIAALSISIPSIKCSPDDAENDLDRATAKAGDKIAELVYKHNDVILLWLHALFIYCTEGLVACYNYTDEDEKYGTYTENEYEDVDETRDVRKCPECKAEMPNAPPASPLEEQANENEDKLEDEYDPEDVEVQDLLQGGEVCINCLQSVIPEITQEQFVVTRLTGTTHKPKSRQCLEVYGGLFVKVPTYARCQAECPYLRYSYEQHYSLAIAEFPDLKDQIAGSSKIRSDFGGATDQYERWGRTSTQYYGEYPINVVTCNNWWFRPEAYEVLAAEEDVKKLKKKYPNGVKVRLVNDLFGSACNEDLDDHWTLTKNPTADYLIHDPIGMLLTSIQDITNDLISLIVQTIEHGVPQTFADPSTLNFKAYREQEVRPGDIFPAISKSGKSLSESFYEVKTAVLSAETMPFGDKIQELGQLTVGALPSLFGGAAPGGSKTAAQYSMSRAQAIQRLQTPWKMFTIWWKVIFSKVIPAYIKSVKDDERIVSKDKFGNFINTYIRKAELEGKLGDIELEASEQLPITWAAKKDIIMQLMQASNPIVMQALSEPENIAIITEAIGLGDFEIPGTTDRDKQYEEIQLLVNSEPLDDQTPSVSIDPDVDNNQVQAEICKNWLVGESGRLAKTENEAGYRNVLLHLKQHVMAGQQAQMTQPQPEPQPAKPLAARPNRQGAMNAV